MISFSAATSASRDSLDTPFSAFANALLLYALFNFLTIWGTTKEYEAAYKKAILYFDDGLAELKGKADEYGKAKVSSQPKEISAINYEGKKEAARDRARKEHEVTETKSSMIQKSVPQMVKKFCYAYRHLRQPAQLRSHGRPFTNGANGIGGEAQWHSTN